MSTGSARRKLCKGPTARYQAFLQDGIRADAAMQQSGVGYDAETVRSYLKAKASAAKTRRPRARRWLT